MSSRGRLVIAGTALLFVLVPLVLFKLASSPNYQTVVAGVKPADTAKITAALDSAGIPYQLGANGTSVSVPRDQGPQARVALGGAGITNSSDQPGFELFDNQKLSTSSFQQQVDYQRALEGEIGKTISGIAGVSGARVQLVLPPTDQLYQADASSARAAVVLDGTAANLDPGAVKSMANIVTSSVSGLKSDNVTIADSSGTMLWPQGSGSGELGGKVAAQNSYQNQLNLRLNAMLDNILGPGKAHVESQVDMNVDQSKTDALTYSGQGVILQSGRETESLDGSSAAGAGGTAGVAGNVPSYAITANGTAATGKKGKSAGSGYTDVKDNSAYGVNKTVTHTTIAPGAINRLDVSVVLDSNTVKPAQLTQIQKTLAGAAGIDKTRGDTLTVTGTPFAKATPAAKPSALPVSPLGLIKPVGIGLGVLFFLFIVTRQLRKREREGLASPTWVNEVTRPMAIAELEGGTEPMANGSKMELAALAASDPERLAHQVRTWMDDA